MRHSAFTCDRVREGQDETRDSNERESLSAAAPDIHTSHAEWVDLFSSTSCGDAVGSPDRYVDRSA